MKYFKFTAKIALKNGENHSLQFDMFFQYLGCVSIAIGGEISILPFGMLYGVRTYCHKPITRTYSRTKFNQPPLL